MDWNDRLSLYQPTTDEFTGVLVDAARVHGVIYPEIIRTIIGCWLEDLNKECHETLRLFSQEAIADVVAHSAQSVSVLLNPTLYSYECVLRRRAALPIIEGQGSLTYPDLQILFKAFPVLRRLLFQRLCHLTEFYRQFLNRLKTDFNLLRELAGSSFDKICRIEPGLSDPHCGLKTVVKVHPNSGHAFFYKPRNQDIEEAFKELVQHLNREHICDLLTTEVTSRGSYGWARCIEHKNCENEKEAEEYFFRAGQLGFVLYALGATDFHYENLVAHGEFPIPVDLETLFHTDIQFSRRAAQNSEVLAWSKLRSSILASGFFPNWAYPIAKGHSVDVSAMKGRRGQPLPWMERIWSRTAEGLATVSDKQAFTRQANNLPMLKGLPLDSRKYVTQVVNGFEMAYRRALESISKLQEALNTASFAMSEARYIHRDTFVYKLLLVDAFNPDRLVDESSYLAGLRKLPKTPMGLSEDLQDITESEINDLAVGDIPVFRYILSSGEVRNSNGRVVAVSKGMIERAAMRVNALSGDDLNRQLALIQTCFVLSEMDSKDSELSIRAERDEMDEGDSPEIVTKKIIRTSVTGDHQSISWIGFEPLTGHGRARLAPVGYDFYSGKSGIGALLAAMSRYDKSSQLYETIKNVVADVELQIANTGVAELTRRMGLGAFTGFPSILYGLTLIAQLTSDSSLLDRVCQYTTEFSKSADYARDPELDYMTGQAGGIVVLSRLYELTRDPMMLKVASRRFQFLMEQRRGHVAGTFSKGSGLAHGELGLLLSMCMQYKCFKNPQLLEDILCTFEHCFAKLESSRDLSWCSGIAGLAQVFCIIWREASCLRPRLPTNPAEMMRLLHDIPPINVENVCCGMNARMSALLSISLLLEDGRDLVSAGLIDYQKQRQALTNPLSGIFNPSFFQGLGGIAYAKLRLRDPSLPCIEVCELM